MPKLSTQKPVEELSYEEAFLELESIVTGLESGQHSLDEAMAMFERGQVLRQRCSGLLDQAELKVKQLSGEELNDFSEE
ncbi:MAG: exodeoxyribonuclease VII small subunit [Anaerolineales bacterium]|nr:exodeoxyribonuclease VII small subunit [Anaerolineales bacterium]